MADKTSVSDAESYAEIGRFWDGHDATETGGQQVVHFDVEAIVERHYLAVDQELYRRIARLANARGVSDETLVNLLLQEQLQRVEPTT